MEMLGNSGCIRQFARFAREQGIALEALIDGDLREVLRASYEKDRVPAHAIVDMLQICSVKMDRPALGASTAAWAKINGGFGPLSLVWDHAPTLADALRVNRQYIHLENGAVGFNLSDEDENIALEHILMVPARFGASQFVEASLTLEVRIIRMILGSENWSPVRVELAHHAPPTIRIQQNIFRCPMDFNSDRNAVVLKRRDLKQPSRNGNAQMFAFLERQIRTEDSAAPVELPRRVEQIIAAKLVRGEATLEHVAHGLGMSPRALQRHLAGHNLAFADLLIEVRTRITDEYFGGERRPNLTALAHRLGYSDNSAVSRFLRKHLNTGARALRAQKGAMKCREPALH